MQQVFCRHREREKEMRWRYVMIDGELVEITPEIQVADAPMVMPDIQPYQSMVDGSIIGSRSRHREHLRRHGLIEVGNERIEPRADLRKTGAKEALVRSLQEAKAKHGSRAVELAISDAMNRAHELKRR